jgi:hypothetical protein
MARPRDHQDPQQGFHGIRAVARRLLEQEASERHKLGRKIAMEEDWLRYASMEIPSIRSVVWRGRRWLSKG